MYLTWLYTILAIALINAAVVKQPEKTTWDLLEALSASGRIKAFSGKWMNDDEFYYFNAGIMHHYNAATNTDTALNGDLTKIYPNLTSLTLSPNKLKFLVRYDQESIFRHSTIAKYDVYTIATNTSTSIHGGRKLQDCMWSPIKDRLSYVYENNAYVHFEDGIERQLTYDGITGVIYNGVPDWVYEEEVLASGNAMWWSPDGEHLAVGHFNDTNVRVFKYPMYGNPGDTDNQYPRDLDLKYPKPGTPNPVVALRVFDLIGREVVPRYINITAPADIVSADHIMQNVAWYNNNSLLVTWMNRRQNIASIQSCSTFGKCNEVKQFAEPKGWVFLSTPICLKQKEACLFIYWIDDWLQVWKLNLTSGENEWRSRGNFTVLNIYGYDEANDNLYYQATLPGEPAIYHVFKNDECLTCDMKDVDGDNCVTATASFSENYSYYAMTCSGPNPRYVKIFQTKDKSLVKDWELNTNFRDYLEYKLMPTVKFFNVTLADNSIGIAKLEYPPNFDEKKKYPMIVEIYSGPDSVRVTSNFNVHFNTFMITSRDVIYAKIDVRGSGNKGKNVMYAVNNDLGHFESEDLIFVTRNLQQQFPYIDPERTGIWGWSYGGYATAKVLEADDDNVFQCGISVAPVTSWIYYGNIYTERYMGLPTAKDNLVKYNESSVLNNVENFRNHDFLLVHGSGDDNVHFQHSVLLAKALQQRDIFFEQVIYGDEAHSISNFLTHLYKTMDHFWTNCLNLTVENETE